VDQELDLPKLLQLRKATRSVADYFRTALEEQLTAMRPLFDPRRILGDYIRDTPKRMAPAADAAFKELRTLYAQVGRAAPFRFEDDIRAPLDLFGATAEIHPVVYSYTPASAEDATPIQVTCPLRWTLTYKGLGPSHLDNLLTSRSGTARMELQSCLLHYCLMHLVIAQQPGVGSLLRALRFEVQSEPTERLGGLPLVYVSAPVTTVLPGDDIILESTELTGATVFEEIIDVDSVVDLRDAMRDAVIQLVKTVDGALIQ
jgi:hypothetical protein